MKRKFLVSYWLYGRDMPDDHVFELKNVTNFQVPMALKRRIANYESCDEEEFDPSHVTLINFWEIS